MSRYIPVTETAKLVRKTLKGAFPSTSFSVRSKSYSMGASISVHWTDGPTASAVDTLLDPFVGSTFDGMIDLKSSVTGDLNGEPVRFGSDHIFTTRNKSEATTDRLVAKFTAETGIAYVKGVELPACFLREEGVFSRHGSEKTWAESLIEQAFYNLPL